MHRRLLEALQPELAALSAQLNLHQYARREVVLSKDDAQQALGFLVEGRLQGVDFTVDGRSVGLYFVDPGDYFGELPVIDGHKPSEHIVAAVKSTVAFWPASSARETILTHPELARRVLLRRRRLVLRPRSGAASGGHVLVREGSPGLRPRSPPAMHAIAVAGVSGRVC